MCQQASPVTGDSCAVLLSEIEELLRYAQQNDVSPVHLPDIVRDFLYEKYASFVK